MAKAKPKSTAPQKSQEPKQATAPKQSFTVLPIQNFWILSLILAFICFALYCNTFDGEYALDDGIVIEQNEYVQKGFGGIWDIFTKDAYDSFYKQMGSTQQLSGGRYRPLSIVTFAIEQDIFTDSIAENGYKVPSHALASSMDKGTSFNLHLANIRHVVSVILYIISIVVLFYFLRMYIFKSSADLAFFTTLLFLAHPLHTEVVANVKSRDEILSFLFITITLIFSFEYVNDRKNIFALVISLACYFLALLSKEYAIVLIALIPVMVYVFTKASFRSALIQAVPYLVVFILYAIMRFNIIAAGQYDIAMRDPNFLCQNPGIAAKPRLYQNYKIATQQIDNPEVLNNPYLGAKKGYKVVNVTQPSGCVIKEKQFDMNLFIRSEEFPTKISTVSNYLKLVFFPHPLSSDYSFNQIPYKTFSHYSVWLSLLIHFTLIYFGWVFIRKRHIIGFAIFIYLVYLSMVGNILMDIGATMGERLIYHSSLGFCIAITYLIFELAARMKNGMLRQATVLIVFTGIVGLYGFKTVERNEDWKSDITLFTKDVETVPNSVLANGNAGARCIDLADFPENKDKREEYLKKAIQYLNKALSMHPKYVNGYLNLGLANYKLKNLEQSDAAWAMARKYFPNNPYLRQFCPLLAQEFLTRGFKKAEQKDFAGALNDIQKAAELDPGNFMMFYHLGGAFYTMGNYNKAYESWQRCLQINPNFEEAKKGLAALQPLVKK